MTNQDVINFLNQVRKMLLDDRSWLESTIQPINEAFDKAISALQAQEVNASWEYAYKVSLSMDNEKAQKPEPCEDVVSRQAAIDAADRADYTGLAVEDVKKVTDEVVKELKQLPSAEPKWNNHTVACMLAELFDDTCACNYNGIDEWLPSQCELLDSCPTPVGVACWEQYLKHRAERRTDEGD